RRSRSRAFLHGGLCASCPGSERGKGFSENVVLLLPGQIKARVPRQIIQRMRLDAMKNLDGRPMRRNQVVPAPGRMTRRIKPQDVCRQRIASAEVVEQPPLESGRPERLLNCSNVLSHGIPSIA